MHFEGGMLVAGVRFVDGHDAVRDREKERGERREGEGGEREGKRKRKGPLARGILRHPSKS